MYPPRLSNCEAYHQHVAGLGHLRLQLQKGPVGLTEALWRSRHMESEMEHDKIYALGLTFHPEIQPDYEKQHFLEIPLLRPPFFSILTSWIC